MAERRLPFTVTDDEGASHRGELLIVRAWQPDLELSPDTDFTIVLAEQPLAPDSPPPASGNVVICAPATQVRLPAAVAEAAVAYEAGDAPAALPLRLPRPALAAYADGTLLAARPLSISPREVFGEGASYPRLEPLIHDLLAASQLAEACWRELDRILSSPRPPAQVSRPERLRARLSDALGRLPAAEHGAPGTDAISRLRDIAAGAAPELVAASAAALADDVAFLRCLMEQPEAAAELAVMRTYLAGAKPGPQAGRLAGDLAFVREQLSFTSLLSQPHRLESLRATFTLFRSDYARAYAAHHERYWRAFAHLHNLLDEAAPLAQALARLNTLRSLGQPVGQEALAAYERLTHGQRTCPAPDLDSTLQEQPLCPDCWITMETGVPSQETEEVLHRLQKALALQQARLSSEAVRRILARGGERIEQFLQIVQASDLTGLTQVLDEELLAFLLELLAQPVAPAPAALELLQELVRAHPSVSEEQVEEVTQTLRQLLIEMLESQRAADPSHQAAISLASALPRPPP